MSHALFVGATGMLKEAAFYFVRHAYAVSVIARGQSGLDRMILEKKDSGFINPVRVDYSNYPLLRKKVTESVADFGPVELCVAWIHHYAPDAAYVIADILNGQEIPFRFFHVLGCEYANPYETNLNAERDFKKFKNISYRKVVLGFICDDENSRWLTNQEISNGVIDAINADRETYIVGTVNPWEKRPKF